MGERASRRRSETPGEESRCGLSWTEAVQASATHRGCERPNASSRGALGSERLIAQDSPTRLLRTAVPGTRALCAPPEGGTSETRRSTGEALTWAHAARCSARSPRTSGRCPPPAWRSDTGTSRSATDSAPACHSFVSPNAPGIATKRSDNAFRQSVQMRVRKLSETTIARLDTADSAPPPQSGGCQADTVSTVGDPHLHAACQYGRAQTDHATTNTPRIFVGID
jgi:hypothetical protein